MDRDHVDDILDQWVRERPDLDTSPIGVIGRISRVARHLERALQTTFTTVGLQAGEFDVLAALRRSGPPYRLSPSELFNTLMLSSGAMTNRIDRLERAGLVARAPDPDDRRGILVSLTSEGHTLIDAAVGAHVANEARLLSVLTPAEREHLADLLRKLLVAFEGNTHAPVEPQPGE